MVIVIEIAIIKLYNINHNMQIVVIITTDQKLTLGDEDTGRLLLGRFHAGAPKRASGLP